MTLLQREVDGSKMGARLAALDRVVELGKGRLEPDMLVSAERLAGKAAERLRLGAQYTIVALAGTTGSGKSSLFNALVGAEVSTPGMRRPTTSSAHAAVWDSAEAGAAPLLDWIDVPRRHRVAGEESLDGLVLLDLPDLDSVRAEHRMEVDRLVDLVDLVVWVVDPQKYADAALHEEYLRPLRAHADVMVVAFNQVDRVPPARRQSVLNDMRGLLEDSMPIVPTSAKTGEGLDELRGRLAATVSAHRAALRRLDADLRSLAASAGPVCTAEKAGKAPRHEVVAALTDASGAQAVSLAVARSHRSRTRAATGWPVTRWLAKLRRDPARRLGLPAAPNELVRTSLPGPSAIQQAQIDTALRRLVDRAAGGLPEPWPSLVAKAAGHRRTDLPDLLDRAVAGAELGLRKAPRWWTVARALQTLLALAAIAGAIWLVGLFVLDWAKLPEPPLPSLHEAGWRVPVPTLLLVAGILLGILLGLLCGRIGAVGARRRGAAARRRIAARVENVATEAVFDPVERELRARNDLCSALRSLT